MSSPSAKTIGSGVLLLLAILSTVAAAAVQMQKELTTMEATHSHAELAGAKVVLYGLNARTGQHASIPLFNYTYQEGQLWTCPQTGKKFRVPDQMQATAQGKQITQGCENLHSNFTAAFSDYMDQYSFADQGNHSGAFAGAGNTSSELITINKYLNQSTNTTIEYGYSSFSQSYYSVDLEPAFILPPSSFWQSALSALPSTINSTHDEKLYRQFVEAYGTHYISYATFGGSIHSVTFVNKSVIAKRGGSTIVNDMFTQFSSYINEVTTPGASGSHPPTPSWYPKETKTFNFVKGGDVSVAKARGNWLPTVADHAAIISSTLSPLDDLVLSNPTQASTLAAFIKKYIAGG